MDNLIKMLVSDIAKSEMDFELYHSLRNHDGWKMHLQYLEKLRLLMSVDMLNDSFTKLSAEEKDIRQRTYAGINTVLNFLVNPFERIQKRAKFKMVEQKARRDKTAFKPKQDATLRKP